MGNSAGVLGEHFSINPIECPAVWLPPNPPPRFEYKSDLIT